MILFALIFIINCGYALSISKEDCPSGVPRDYFLQVYGDSCFEFVTFLQRDFFEAESYCQRNNGHLVSIESEEVNDWIVQELRNTYYAALVTDQDFWIGFNDRDSENNHEWMDGSDVSFMHWAPHNGPLSRVQPLQTAIDCVVLNSDNGYWYDRQCEEGFFNLWGLVADYKKPFVCRFKVDVPEVARSDDGSEDKGDTSVDGEDRYGASETGEESFDDSGIKAESDKGESGTAFLGTDDDKESTRVGLEEEVSKGTTAGGEKEKPGKQSAGKADTPGLPTEASGKEDMAQPKDQHTEEDGKATSEEDKVRADIDSFYKICGQMSCDKPCGMAGYKTDDRGCFLCECDDDDK